MHRRAPVAARSAVAVLPIVAVLASMSSVQAGAAVSVPLFADFGVAGTTWLRLTVAAAVATVLARPRAMRRSEVAAAALLGVVMAVNAVTFAAATDRVALGPVVAVEFCGPLGVAVARARGLRRVVWPGLALLGVVLITRPSEIGGVDAGSTWLGLGFAVLAALGWAGYIVLTAHVGRRSEGLRGLSVALIAAAVALAPLGIGPAWRGVRQAVTTGGGAWTSLVWVVVAALLVPLTAYGLEMAALRHLPEAAFGVLMALEPAIGTLIGSSLLAQHVSAVQVPGVLLVVAAGIGAQKGTSGVHGAERACGVDPSVT